MKTFIVYLFWMIFSSLLVKIGLEQVLDKEISFLGTVIINLGIQLSTVIPVGLLASANRKDGK